MKHAFIQSFTFHELLRFINLQKKNSHNFYTLSTRCTLHAIVYVYIINYVCKEGVSRGHHIYVYNIVVVEQYHKNALLKTTNESNHHDPHFVNAQFNNCDKHPWYAVLNVLSPVIQALLAPSFPSLYVQLAYPNDCQEGCETCRILGKTKCNSSPQYATICHKHTIECTQDHSARDLRLLILKEM